MADLAVADLAVADLAVADLAVAFAVVLDLASPAVLPSLGLASPVGLPSPPDLDLQELALYPLEAVVELELPLVLVWTGSQV